MIVFFWCRICGDAQLTLLKRVGDGDDGVDGVDGIDGDDGDDRDDGNYNKRFLFNSFPDKTTHVCLSFPVFIVHTLSSLYFEFFNSKICFFIVHVFERRNYFF